MRFILCVFIFIAVVAAGLSGEIAKRLGKPGDTQTASLALSSRQAAPAREAPRHGRMVRLNSDGRGHFKVDARVDGRAVDFLVDTGASAVVLRESAAARLGIFVRPSQYTGRTQTANGVARYAPVKLNRVEVEGIVVRDVDAAVMSDDALQVNLLGMTFLSRVRFTYDRGRLVLEQ
jgi:aspartyl protease family protein